PSRHSEKVISALHTVRKRPLLGSGLGTHPALAFGYPADTDLTPLNIAATLGSPTLLAFAGSLVALWRCRPRPPDRADCSGLAALALYSLASDVEDWRHCWVLIGMADSSSKGQSPGAPRTEAAGPQE